MEHGEGESSERGRQTLKTKSSTLRDLDKQQHDTYMKNNNDLENRQQKDLEKHENRI